MPVTGGSLDAQLPAVLSGFRHAPCFQDSHVPASRPLGETGVHTVRHRTIDTDIYVRPNTLNP